jgi:FkbM family methyltransferase
MDLAYNSAAPFTRWVVQRGLVKSAFTAVDIGVQGGIHPRWDALGDALRVYGFDPLSETIEPLASLNLPSHRYYALAIGDEDGERDFFVPQILPASSFFPREAEQDQARMAIDSDNWCGTETRRVPIRRLDTLLADSTIADVNFIKIDCEGFEPAVLHGARNLLANRDLLAIESEIGFSSIHWPQTHFTAVYEQLVPHGFRLCDLACTIHKLFRAGETARARKRSSLVGFHARHVCHSFFSRDDNATQLRQSKY